MFTPRYVCACYCNFLFSCLTKSLHELSNFASKQALIVIFSLSSFQQSKTRIWVYARYPWSKTRCSDYSCLCVYLSSISLPCGMWRRSNGSKRKVFPHFFTASSVTCYSALGSVLGSAELHHHQLSIYRASMPLKIHHFWLPLLARCQRDIKNTKKHKAVV